MNLPALPFFALARALVFAWVLACLVPAGAQVLTLRQAQATALAAGGASRAVPLPHEWEDGFHGFSGILEYRIPFSVLADDALLAVYIQRACSNLEVRVNGELIGSGGSMQPPVTRNCYYPQLFPLPRSLLRPGVNDLRVRVAGYAASEVSARQRAAGLSAVQVGPISELRESYERQRFWNITAAQIIATSVVGLGLAVLCLWALRRVDSYLLFFGLFTAGWGVISTRLFVRDLPLSHAAVEILICSAFPPVLGWGYLFLLHLVDLKWRWASRLVLGQSLLVPLCLLAVRPTALLPVATTVYNLLAIEFLLAVGCFFVVAWRTHRQDFWLLGGVLLLAIVLAGVEVALQNELLPLPKVHVIHFAMPLIFAVIALRLIQLFVRALQHAETLNEQLEHRIALKSEELERNWEQIARLSTEQAAQDERRRIASDLHDDLGARLLTIAQAGQRGGEPERIAAMARQALDEMRLSVRGLTGHSQLTADVLADWRAETMTRLAEAGVQAAWHGDEPAAGTILPARLHVQLTRILREAVSNVIRHSGAAHCTVRVAFPAGHLRLEVEDDGRGLPAAGERVQRGHGLPNIERRARHLGGDHHFEAGRNGGTRVAVRVPLAAGAYGAEMP